jgi:hypothetical protein
MVKSSKSSMKKIKGPFEKYNLFEKMDLQDNCWEVDGVKVVGPGVFCWIFIFLIVLQFFTSLFMIPQFREMGMTDGQIAFRYAMSLLFAFLSSTFMFSMCSRCRGLEGLLILILLQFIYGLITIAPFFAKVQQDVKSLKASGRVVEGLQCGGGGGGGGGSQWWKFWKFW